MFDFVDDESGDLVDVYKVCEQLALFYDQFGRDGKLSRLNNIEHRNKRKEIIGKLDISEGVKSDVHFVLMEVKEERERIEAQIVLQDAIVKESSEMIAKGMGSYIQAVVSGDDPLVKQIEKSIGQYEENIKWAGIRKIHFDKEGHLLDRSLYCLKDIFHYAERGLLEIEVEKDEEKYKSQLNAFVGSFEEYYKSVRRINRFGLTKETLGEDVIKELRVWNSR